MRLRTRLVFIASGTLIFLGSLPPLLVSMYMLPDLSNYVFPCFANFSAPIISGAAVLFFAKSSNRVGLMALAFGLLWVVGVWWFWIGVSSLYQIDIS